MQLPIPPLSSSTPQALKAALNAAVAPQGYAFEIERSKPGPGGKVKAVYLRCDRGGKYVACKSFNKRERSTRLTGCLYNVVGRLDKGSGVYRLEEPRVGHREHNHPPSIDASSHPSLRKAMFTPADVQYIEESTRAGATIKQQAMHLRRNEDEEEATLITSKDISNIKQSLRMDRLGFLTPEQALLQQLQNDPSWWCTWQSNANTNALEYLFFSHQSSQALLKEYHEVIFLDATYKTNRYNMPLLVITGSTATNSTFYIAFCFLKSCFIDDYAWALTNLDALYIELDLPKFLCAITDADPAQAHAIEDLFPNANRIYCLWHTNRNVTTNCKKYFETNEQFKGFMNHFQAVVNAPTEDEIQSKFQILENRFRPRYPLAVEYLVFLLEYRCRMLCKAFTNTYLHFGNTSTSRSEGANSKLKSELSLATGDLQYVVDKVSNLYITERKEYLSAISYQENHMPIKLRGIEAFSHLTTNISLFALNKILEQYQLVKYEATKPLKPCTNSFTRSMGLPCAHRIKSLIRPESSMSIPLSEIHRHWYLKPNEDIIHDPILELRAPARARTSGRPRGSRNIRNQSSRRDPSAHEWAEAEWEALHMREQVRQARQRAIRVGVERVEEQE